MREREGEREREGGREEEGREREREKEREREIYRETERHSSPLTFTLTSDTRRQKIIWSTGRTDVLGFQSA